MINRLYLVGSGDYGRCIKSYIKKDNLVNSVHFVDDKIKLNIKNFLKKKNKIYYNLTISHVAIRENLYLKFTKKKFIYKSLIFPNNNIYSNIIGDGCILEPGIIISNNVLIGKGNFIFFGSSIAHNVNIGNFCNIGTNVVISGNTKIGNKVIIGGNSFISNNLEICDNVTISPASVVLKSIKKPGIYLNNTIIR